jgi:hypothetical protein
MGKIRTYNVEAAKQLSEKFVEITGLDLTSKTRHQEESYLRALLYKVMVDINGMNDRMISDWFQDMGVKRNRSSIFHALRKINVYYENYVKFRNIYDLFFDDKKKQRERIESKRSERVRIINERIAKKLETGERNKIHELADVIPDDRIDEMYEMMNLRIKSWNWKSKDKCEIIDSSTSMEGMHW